MSFFSGSSYLTISGGTFTNINLPTPEAASRRSNRNLDGLMIVQADDVDLHRELISGNRYRIYSASHRGRFVAVRTFEGPRAKQDWAVGTALSRKAFHPNVLKLVGVSEENSDSYFVLLHGITSEQKMQSLIAKALRTDLNTSIQISMKSVRGIAAGLSYLKFQNIPMHAGGLNFDVFIGHENEPIISFHPSNATHDDGSVLQNLDIETGDHGVEVLNRLCQQLFSGANSILYDDSPERNFDAYDRGSLPTTTLEDVEGTPNLSESGATSGTSGSTEKSKSNTTPRREVWWLDLGGTNQCIESIKRCFEDYLDRFLISSSNSLLRRIKSPGDNNLRRNIHQCPGYLREEITLTSDVSRSAIVSHAFPTQSELCLICGQLVQYAYSHPSITGAEIEWSEDGPDLSVFDGEGGVDMDYTPSPSVSSLSSTWSDASEESDHEQAEDSAEAIARRLAIKNNILAVGRIARVFQNLREESENAIERKTNSASGSNTYHADYSNVSPSVIQNGDSYNMKLPMTLPGVKQWLSKNFRKKTLSPDPSGTSVTFFPPPTTDVQPTIILNKKPFLSDIVGRKENEPIAEYENVNSANGQKGPAKPKVKSKTMSRPPGQQSSISNFSLKNTGSGTMANNNVGNIINSTISDVGNDYSRNYVQARRKPDLSIPTSL